MSIARSPLWLPGLLAVLVGVGLGRFAYTPLLPALVAQDWLSETQAAYAGAANLAGYLAGALVAQALAARRERIAILNGALVAAAISLIACAWPLGFFWMAPWRFVAGMAGAFIMVLGPATILAATATEARPRVSGMIFVGVGLGIILSGTLLPAIAASGLVVAWLTLGIAACALTAATWRLWPQAALPSAPSCVALPGRLTVLLVILAYASDGIGFVPHTLFLSDFIARGLDQGEFAGGIYWAVFGAGAVIGAPTCGLIASRFGLMPSFIGALVLKATAVALPLAATQAPFLALSAFLVGALTPGMVALAAGLAAMLAHGPAQARLFGAMTIAFALAQAGGGYLMSWIFGLTQSHMTLFALGAAMLAGGAIAASMAAIRLGRG
ncbi:YbfB/YjiJ family MFS transporter [Saliniramus sp.]|uniref:YbfB/YjiJ family MFS transporter n=1 Tax=Saliniramus sp. TaxID=2986772 RepID=UPI002D165F7B|nr:YbfB/YjiJ family MFS transporter [Saliniramus sp.]HMB10865.1 YbfB/YjiJ family MFS transporter [Saliniramus sp.]